MSKSDYTVSVNDGEMMEITESEIQNLDIVALPDGSGHHLIHKGKGYTVKVLEHDAEDNQYVLLVNDYEYRVKVEDRWTKLIQKMGLDKKPVRAIAGLAAPMPGLVRSVEVSAGDQVPEGEILLVMEAMKMENQLKAPALVTVAEVMISPGDVVEKGQQLLRFEV